MSKRIKNIVSPIGNDCKKLEIPHRDLQMSQSMAESPTYAARNSRNMANQNATEK